ncbi:hypothetical protein Tco_0138657 [Tanacetum coccineum]
MLQGFLKEKEAGCAKGFHLSTKESGSRFVAWDFKRGFRTLFVNTVAIGLDQIGVAMDVEWVTNVVWLGELISVCCCPLKVVRVMQQQYIKIINAACCLEMITSQLQEKLWIYDEVHTRLSGREYEDKDEDIRRSPDNDKDTEDSTSTYGLRPLSGFSHHPSKGPIFDQGHVHGSNPPRFDPLLPPQCISYYIHLTRMIANFAVIVAEKLYPAMLMHVQFLLVKDVQKTLMVSIDNTLCLIQVMSPDAYAITLPLCNNKQPNPKPNASQYTTKSSCPSRRARTEKVVKERDELKLKIEKWEESSKNLDELLNSQMSARDKTGLGYGTQLNEMSNNSETNSEISLSVFYVRSSDEESTPANDRFSKADGYHVVPPPITGNFLTPRADISFAGLDEYAIRKKIIESKTTDLNTKTSETVGKTNEANTQKPKTVYESVNRDKVIIEDWNSDDEDDVSAVKIVSPVKTNETQTVRNRFDKIG